MSSWYIDRLDSRAGIAFASCRNADLETDAIEVGLAAVRIGPPGFEPEFLGGRSLGFAAPLGLFQEGLFTAEGELDFESLETLIAFVRRAYLASGAGDARNAIGPGFPGPPPEPSPESSGARVTPDEEMGGQTLGAIAQLIDTHQRASRLAAASLSGAEPVVKASDAVDASAPDAPKILAQAALLLIAGLVERLPAARPDMSAWLDWSARLGHAIGRLGLWDAVLGDSSFERLASRVADWDRQGRIDGLGESPGDPGTLARLLGHARIWRMAYTFDDGAHAAYFIPPPDGLSEATDAFDDLERWPLPPVTVVPSVTSLRDLLCLALGAPLELSRAGPQPLALLLFAAVHLVARGRALPMVLEDGGRRALQARLVADASAWLRAELPDFAFSPEIEKMIAGAASIQSYMSPPPSAASLNSPA